MPWTVSRSDDCPADRPWAVINDETGETEGCHPTEDDARAQQQALYANVDEDDEMRRLPNPEAPEVRSVAFTDVETSKDGATFVGYAAVYEQDVDFGDWSESIARGAFRKVLRTESNVPMLYDHNPNWPVLATTGGGTLKLEEDGKGLRVEAEVANHFAGEAVRELVKRGDIRGMSFGFVAGAGNSRLEKREGKPHRTLTNFKRLLDVSPTWEPAYPGTSAELRALKGIIGQMAESLEREQQASAGACSQCGGGAPEPAADTGEDSQEARAGAGSNLLAAKRRLRMIETTIPKEFRR